MRPVKMVDVDVLFRLYVVMENGFLVVTHSIRNYYYYYYYQCTDLDDTVTRTMQGHFTES